MRVITCFADFYEHCFMRISAKTRKNRQRLEEEIYGKQKIKTYLLLLLLFMRTSSRAPPVL